MLEVYGAGFTNKGAQLMLWTVVERLRSECSEIGVCTERRGSFRERAAYGLHTIVPGYVGGRAPAVRRAMNAVLRHSLDLISPDWLADHGLVTQRAPDALIDASGYAYGDKWELSVFERFARRAAQYKSRGKPVVMMPQMFGPFEKPGYAEAFRKVLSTVDIAFARDTKSLEHARQAAPGAAHLRSAPDITIFGATPEVAATEGVSPYVCIVPNMRMTDQGRDEWGGEYLNLLTRAGRQVLDHGLRVDVLLHEASQGDASMGRELVAALGSTECRLVEEPDPRAIKAHLAGSRFIISSRFHSIVGALSSGVPAITLGWAHKYEMLLQEFGVPQFSCRAQDAALKVPALVREMLEEPARTRYREELLNAKRSMKASADAMWEEVFRRIGITRHEAPCPGP